MKHVAYVLSTTGEVLQQVETSTPTQAWRVLQRLAMNVPDGYVAIRPKGAEIPRLRGANQGSSLPIRQPRTATMLARA